VTYRTIVAAVGMAFLALGLLAGTVAADGGKPKHRPYHPKPPVCGTYKPCPTIQPTPKPPVKTPAPPALGALITVCDNGNQFQIYQSQLSQYPGVSLGACQPAVATPQQPRDPFSLPAGNAAPQASPASGGNVTYPNGHPLDPVNLPPR
jgi:hypothetical protein